MDIEEYILTHIDAEPELLKQVDRKTHLYNPYARMCSGHLQGRILKMFVGMIQPRRILELGAFTGYSALSLAEGMPDGCTLDTIEADDELEDLLRHNFSMSPRANDIHLHIGDAKQILTGFRPESFSLAFIDANKREYPEYYRLALPLIHKGGYIIADNTLWYGHVVETETRHDAQTEGIMQFNDMVAADPTVEKVIIPLRDGLTVIRKL